MWWRGFGVLRRFCTAATQTSALPGVIPTLPEVVGANVKEAVAYRKGVKGSLYKLNDLCYMVRFMNTTEALAQMQFSLRRKYAEIVRDTIKSAVRNAEHNFNMDASRLLIVRADVGRATPMKRIKMHAKGRFGRMERPRAHLRIVVREVPREEKSEHRLGLRGRTNRTLEGNSKANGRLEKWRRRKQSYGKYLKGFDAEKRPVGSVTARYLRQVQSEAHNPREWRRAKLFRVPPTQRTHEDHPLRLLFDDHQPNGGLAPLPHQTDRRTLGAPARFKRRAEAWRRRQRAGAVLQDGELPDSAFGGVSATLAQAIRETRAQNLGA